MVNEGVERCTKDDFLAKLKKFGVKADAELCNQIAVEWQSPNPKNTKVYVLQMAEYYLNRYPTEPKVETPPVVKAKRRSKAVKGTPEVAKAAKGTTGKTRSAKKDTKK